MPILTKKEQALNSCSCAQQGVAYQVTLRLRHNFLLAGENPMLTRMLLPSFEIKIYCNLFQLI